MSVSGRFPRRIAVVILTTGLWCLASVIGHFTASSTGGLAAIYIPVAILVGLMIRAPRYIREFAVAVVLGSLCINILTDGPLLTTVFASLITVLEAGLVSWLVSRFGAAGLTRPRDGGVLGLATVCGVSVAAVLAAGLAGLTATDPPLAKLVTMIPADMLGILLITPLVVTVTRHHDPRRVLGFAGLFGLASLLALVAVAQVQSGPWIAFLSAYSLLLVVLLVGVRYGVTALGLIQVGPALLIFIVVAEQAQQEWLERQLVAITLTWSMLVAVLAIRSELRSRWSSEQLALDLFEQVPTPTARVRLARGEFEVRRANAAWRAFFGDETGPGVFAAMPAEDRQNLIEALSDRPMEQGARAEVRWHAAGERVLAVQAVGIPGSREWSDDEMDLLISVEDLTVYRAQEADLRAAAFSDPLTGLQNRRAVMQDMGRRLGRDVPTAVLFLDLNNFKQVNDTFGHRVGDDVLTEAARMLTHAFRPDDLVARIGGDEFLVLASLADPGDLPVLKKRAEQALREPLQIGELSLTLDVSVGASLASAHQTPEQAIAAADAAMYDHKQGRTPPASGHDALKA